jgi:hypothetical protein
MPAAMTAAAPPGGPTGGKAGVPWVISRPVNAVVGLEVAGENGSVGLAEQDRSGPAQPGYRARIFFRDIILQPRSARGGHHARKLETILDRDPQAFERAGLAARDTRIRIVRATPCRCDILLHNRVKGRVKALDSGKSRTKEVPRGKFPPKQRRVQIGCGIE